MLPNSPFPKPCQGWCFAPPLGGLPIDEGTLYAPLRRLEAQGLLKSRWREEDKRKKRFDRLTPPAWSTNARGSGRPFFNPTNRLSAIDTAKLVQYVETLSAYAGPLMGFVAIFAVLIALWRLYRASQQRTHS